MLTVNVHEAKTRLSQLLQAVEAGQDVTIARAGRPVARLVSVAGKPAPRKLGGLAGQINIPEDFDAALPQDLLALFDTPLGGGQGQTAGTSVAVPQATRRTGKVAKR